MHVSMLYSIDIESAGMVEKIAVHCCNYMHFAAMNHHKTYIQYSSSCRSSPITCQSIQVLCLHVNEIGAKKFSTHRHQHTEIYIQT
jgi:hypothetical protein